MSNTVLLPRLRVVMAVTTVRVLGADQKKSELLGREWFKTGFFQASFATGEVASFTGMITFLYHMRDKITDC